MLVVTIFGWHVISEVTIQDIKYAESFGAKGLRVTNQEELEAAIKEGYETDGPVLIDIPVNYKDNIKLSTNMLPDVFN